MSLINIDALYDAAKAALAVHNFDLFRTIQLKLSDAMMDNNDESAWILQLDWKAYRVGDNRRKKLAKKRKVTVESLANFRRDTVVFDVPIPDEVRIGGYTRSLGYERLEKNASAHGNMNRVRFAGFPKFGLRFLGPGVIGSRFFGYMRFSWVNDRADSDESRRRRLTSQRKIIRYAEDVVSGGYMSLFYVGGTSFVWRESLQNFEACDQMEEQRTLFDEIGAAS